MSLKNRKLAIKNLKGSDEKLRVSWMLKNMMNNKTFLYFSKNLNKKNKVNLLSKLKKEYTNYRKNWRNNPKEAIRKNLIGEKFNKSNIKPLCIDIEVASVCDLACPHCYRQFISTPDKIMSKSLAFKLIDQASELKVPSMKFNWRGEPLLNPSLPEIIDYAKKKGVLETIINTNATTLDEKMSEKIINSGLDLLIYSFDGGTKQTYEKMRPGRFKKNNFEDVYNNIKNFHEIRKKKKSKFPITKIQMIMTKDTRNEVDDFYSLFNDIVDDVTITQYNERGGNINDLDEKTKNKIIHYLKENELPLTTPYMVDINNNIFVSLKRKPCEQIYQRLMVTYSGRVGMCCHDWGARHGIGYLSDEAYKEEEAKLDVQNKIQKNQKGFELLKNAINPKNFNEPKKKIENLEEIWNGDELNKVRNLHENFKIDSVPVCKECTFKDTYDWKLINI